MIRSTYTTCAYFLLTFFVFGFALVVFAGAFLAGAFFTVAFLTGQINDNVASLVTAQLLFLEAEDPKKEIYLYINSPGGLVTAGLGIYDTMQYIKPEISTLCIGQAASMGSFLLAAGSKGKRFSLPNSRVMVHQPSAGLPQRHLRRADQHQRRCR